MSLVLVASLVCFRAISYPPLAAKEEPVPVSIGNQDEFSVNAYRGHPRSSLGSRNHGTLRGHYPHNYSFDLWQHMRRHLLVEREKKYQKLYQDHLGL